MKPKKQQVEKSRRSSIDVTYAKLFSTEQGRAILEDLENTANMQATGFAAGQADLTAYNLGKKDVVLQIHQKITRGLTHGC